MAAMKASEEPDEQREAVDEAAIEQALDRMWTRFLPDIRERAATLDVAAKAAARGALTQAARADAHAAAHKLAGTLGTFGLTRGTDLARELELLYAGNEAITGSQAQRLAALAGEIKAIIEGRK
jgi:HPt (histidine-containing phosphotransfer) domain-containing protein